MSECDFLLIDDDETFCRLLSRTLERAGYRCQCAHNGAQALALAQQYQPARMVLDLKLDQESGLLLLPQLLACQPSAQIVLLTGYAAIATAVEAIKLGAHDYRPKPCSSTELLGAFGLQAAATPSASEVEIQPLSPDRLAWEQIQRVLQEHDGNISATARALGMHRRTLQRKLAKKPVKQ